MRKILKISLMIILSLCIFINTSYATIDFNLNLNASKSRELKKNDEITVSVNISNVKSDIGLVTFGATLVYPENNLELIDMQGSGNYPNPAYSEKTKKLLIERTPSKDEGTMFTIKFKVKNEDSKTLTIGLNNITASDGSGLFKMHSKNVTLKIKEQTQKPTTPGNTTNGNKPGSTVNPSKPGNTGTTKPGSSTTNKKPSNTSNSGSSTSNKKPSSSSNSGNSSSSKKTSSSSNSGNSSSSKKTSSSSNSGSSTSTKKTSSTNKKDSTVKDSTLPYTGFVNRFIPISLLGISIVSIILFIKIKRVSRQ